MVLSREVGYAIRTLVRLAREPRGRFVPTWQLAQELEIPRSFLSKILRKLVKKGWLTSSRGVRGGVAYAIDPGEITLRDVITAIDGDRLFTRCILGLPHCGDEAPCAIHSAWKPLRDQLLEIFSSTTIRDLTQEEGL